MNGEFSGEDGRCQVAGQKLTSEVKTEQYAQIVERSPVWLIEDGLVEDDRGGWAALDCPPGRGGPAGPGPGHGKAVPGAHLPADSGG